LPGYNTACIALKTMAGNSNQMVISHTIDADHSINALDLSSHKLDPYAMLLQVNSILS
jgi:hypothetical protein